MEYDLMLRNIMLLDPAFNVQAGMSVAIKDGLIAKVEEARLLESAQAAEVLDGSGKLLMPGLVDAHTHTCQQLLRGSLADEFPMIWLRFLVPFESTLTEDDVYHSARLYCLQAIKAGITGFAESGGRHMHRVAQAVLESGMRAAISRSMIDMGQDITAAMIEDTQTAVENNNVLFDEWNGAGEGRLQVYYGMRQVMTCTPELIRLVAEHARRRDTGIHAHLCEHKDEVSFCLQHYKMRPAAFLDSLGILNSNLITAHNVTLSEGDITLLAQRGVTLVHCPYANFINHGFPKTPRILEAGGHVAIGSDGAAYNNVDLFDEMRTLRAGIIAQWGLPVFDPAVLTVKDTLAMATSGGAQALRLGRRLGAVEEGRLADLITIDLHQPHISPTNNYTTAILDTVSGRDVADSIIGGKLVMRGRRVLTLDEEGILGECAQRMPDIRGRMAPAG